MGVSGRRGGEGKGGGSTGVRCRRRSAAKVENDGGKGGRGEKGGVEGAGEGRRGRGERVGQRQGE